MKYSKIHYVSLDQQDLWNFLFFSILHQEKEMKLQTFPQNEKLNDLTALQLRVGGVENYCPNNTGQDWRH